MHVARKKRPPMKDPVSFSTVPSTNGPMNPPRLPTEFMNPMLPAAEVPLTLDDFEAIRARVPVLCDLKPSGRYVATDLHRAGGVPQVMKMLGSDQNAGR